MQKTVVKNILTVVGISLIILSFGIGVYLAYKQGFLGPKVEAQAEPLKVKITNISINGFTVSWVTNGKTYGEIAYGKDKKLKNLQVDDQDQLEKQSKKRKIHYVTVSGLQPATQYFFKIKTGEKKIAVGKDHEPYQVKTAPALGDRPPNKIISGQIEKSPGVLGQGEIVYFNIKGATPLSAQVKSGGNWSIDLSYAYNNKLTEYIDLSVIDSAKILVQGEKLTSNVKLAISKDDQIVPIIILGSDYDFNQLASSGNSNESADTGSLGFNNDSNSFQNDGQDQAQPLQQFPLEPSNNVVGATDSGVYVQESLPVTIDYPASEDELISSTQPEFRGSGAPGKLLTISILDGDGASVASTTMVITSDSQWSFVPEVKLVEGTYTIEVRYSDAGSDKLISRAFKIDLSGTGGDVVKPAFEASASASPSPTPTVKPRVSIPSTSSGVPTSGIELPTMLVMTLGMLMLGFGFVAKGLFE